MAENSCKTCRSWHGCIIPPSCFSYGEIQWCPHQVMWLLKHLETLEAGQRVKEEVSDTNLKSRQLKAEGYFVSPIIIVAELKVRLEATGFSGKLLKAQAKADYTLDMLDPEAWEALMFVSGWRRKGNFSLWKRQQRYRQGIKMDELERLKVINTKEGICQC